MTGGAWDVLNGLALIVGYVGLAAAGWFVVCLLLMGVAYVLVELWIRAAARVRQVGA